MTVASAERPRQAAPPPLIDVLLAVGVVLGLALILAMAQGGARAPDPLAYGFAGGFGAVMLLRRRAPVIVLGLTVIGLFAYYALDYPPIGVAVPLAAALFAAADAGRPVVAVAGGAVALAVSVAFRLTEGEPVALLLGYEAVTNLALIVAAIACGDAVRGRRRQSEQHTELMGLAADAARHDADARAFATREQLSRDLHDSLGHTLSVIAVQIGVAEQSVTDPPAARVALGHVGDASRAALGELRAVVRVLRDPAPDPSRCDVLVAPSIDALVAAARHAGVGVNTAVELPAAVPPQTTAVVMRVVQEALTNVVRHSGAQQAEVSVVPAAGGITVTVRDPGDGRVLTPPRPGNGLAGMSERVRGLGGHVSAAPEAGGGFTVHAWLPAPDPSEPA